MSWPSALALLALAAAAVIAASLAIYAWRHRQVQAARSFTFLMAAVAVMAGGYGMQLSRTTLPASLFWGNVEYVGIVAIPLGWLVFALDYTGRSHVLTRRTLALLAIVPLLTLVLLWSNTPRGLVRQDMRLEAWGALMVPVPTRGPWFWVYAFYGYAVLLAGTALLATTALRGGNLARRQGGAALVAALVPWVSNALYLSRATPFPNLDPTPFAFTVSGLIVAWDLFAFRFLDVVPIARDTVLAGMRDGVIVVDARGRIVELSPAAQTMVGRSAGAALGRPAAEVLAGWPAALTSPDWQPQHDGHVELRLGEEAAQRTYDLQITALRDRRGAVAGRLAVVRDITERVRTLQERERLLQVQAAQAEELARREAETAALRQLDRLKSDLLSTVSHELRTPLTVVHGYAQRLARAQSPEPARVERFAERILTSSSQLVRLVEDLLDFDRLERGAVALQPAVCDLASLLDEVLELFRGHPGGHSLDGEWSGPLWVHADRSRILQVVGNLIENAIRYTSGPITVRAGRMDDPPDDREGLEGSEGTDATAAVPAVVRVEVIDRGPGITHEEQARLWDRFYRGRGVAELNVARGSGIGLAVVKSLVEAHGGRVGLESTPGLGSCFWFELPGAAAP